MPPEPAPNPAELPPGLVPYRHTPEFTGASVPAALLGDHNTKEGSWALIHVRKGRLTYRITDPRRIADVRELVAGGPPGIVEADHPSSCRARRPGALPGRVPAPRGALGKFRPGCVFVREPSRRNPTFRGCAEVEAG